MPEGVLGILLVLANFPKKATGDSGVDTFVVVVERSVAGGWVRPLG